jgi:hypothetical protein
MAIPRLENPQDAGHPAFVFATLASREEQGRMSFHMAAQQFDENITLGGGEAALAANDPEKFNLYAGLLNLARGLQQLEAQVEAIRLQLARR